MLSASCRSEPAPQVQQPASGKQQPISKSAPEMAAPARSTTKKIDANKPGVRRVSAVQSVAAPQPIVNGRAVNGSLTRMDSQLEDGSFVDYYSYNGTRGEQLTITLRSKEVDAYLLVGTVRNNVFDPDEEDDDSGGNTDAKIEMTVGATGTLVIGADALSEGETGSYVLEVTRADIGGGGGGPKSVGTLPLNTPVNGRLEQGDHVMSSDKTLYDYWTFDGVAGQRVVITMKSSAFDSYLVLKRGTPNRSDKIAEDDDGGAGLDAKIECTLPETGVYTVVANAAVPGAGAYTLVVQTVDAPGLTRGPAPNPTSYAARYPGGGNPADKYALVVGIDDYPGTNNDLRGPRADARLFADLLMQRFGFQQRNVVVLLDGDATREHILQAFARHLGQAGPQGTAVFYYSGHGTQMRENLALTAPTDPETDGKDEALFVWGTDSRSSIILDDEIGHQVDLLKTEKVLLVHDSCNSGTSSRDVGTPGQPKTVTFSSAVAETSFLPRTFAIGAPANSKSGTTNVLEGRAPHTLLAASKDEEVSWTASGWPDRGGVASVFTYYLVATLESADDRMTFGQVMERVTTQTVAYTRKNYNAVQTPQTSGVMAARSIASILR
jgi:hypothetical protein